MPPRSARIRPIWRPGPGARDSPERERIPRDAWIEDQGEAVLRDSRQVDQPVEALLVDRDLPAADVGARQLRGDRLAVEEDLDMPRLVWGPQHEEDAPCVELEVDLRARPGGRILVGDPPVAGIGELVRAERARGGAVVLVARVDGCGPALSPCGSQVRLG